jgi:hypothetical protein
MLPVLRHQKEVFYSLRDVNKIERVPGKNGNLAAWQLV